MVKYKAHYWFIGLMLMYLVIRLLRPNAPEEYTFIRYYFTDLLFVPVMSSFALAFIRSIKRNYTLTIPLIYVLLQTALISLYFEVYLPNYSTTHFYTADSLDVLMYFLGAILFMLLHYFRWI